GAAARARLKETGRAVIRNADGDSGRALHRALRPERPNAEMILERESERLGEPLRAREHEPERAELRRRAAPHPDLEEARRADEDRRAVSRHELSDRRGIERIRMEDRRDPFGGREPKGRVAERMEEGEHA